MFLNSAPGSNTDSNLVWFEIMTVKDEMKDEQNVAHQAVFGNPKFTL